MTGVLGDRNPADLHLFRNYDLPGMDYERAEQMAKPFKATPKPAGILAFITGTMSTCFMLCHFDINFNVLSVHNKINKLFHFEMIV